MSNIELLADEVVLYEGVITSKNYKGSSQLTLTSHTPNNPAFCLPNDAK
jgi:hypothetical protein